MATYFKIEYIGGEPTESDYERAAYLVGRGYLEGELINDNDEGEE
jgi:hypothetical protein